MVAAMTVFEQGRPRKGAYRYFALRDLDGPDDYASMDQVITRRFRHEKEGDETFAPAARTCCSSTGRDPCGGGPSGPDPVRR
ncbi:MAG: hypothetical protein ACLR1T_09990 [Evtepia gabavorous]